MTKKQTAAGVAPATAAKSDNHQFSLSRNPEPKSKTAPPSFGSDGNGLPPAIRSGPCPDCGQYSALLPLHGPKGGPLLCPLCVGKWNAEHGRKRRTGRIVYRAIIAFYNAGGGPSDIDKLKLSAGWASLGLDTTGLDPLGYMADIAKIDGADVELTSELLADVLQLTHPDHHPPERQQLAHAATQRLLALKPFVFPAPKPKKKPFEQSPDKKSRKPEASPAQPSYPCNDCKSTVPYFYCDTCKAEWEKRQREKDEQKRAKRRKWYLARKAGRERWLRTLGRRPTKCAGCGAEFRGKRADTRFCSDTCRQRAHRKAVTAKRNKARKVLLAVTAAARVSP